ncbi:MAG: DNA polymerase/3'-5' exonuclease PolX [Candidatus Binatus sp.]|uniref:DNA polymerase/3'-5' exonuclease PolX n=1 Tax=Candidatus Binatus sp. TaxID=2811406 RepID=UPI0027247F92|nr:DNA polymerase/3'-5' exonuclease PolX [Candidatus Binatus sp.]MDO8435035.1 DNA polymerase/3'-5' exonuclease PolX [Candidatus Binatus sp.]
MQNSEIGRVLSEIADMLEITGANFFRVRAYRNAARAVLDYPANFAELSLDKMSAVAGIGKDLSAKIATLASTGELALHRELSAKVPPGVLALMRLPGLGPKRVMQITRELGIEDLAQLKVAVEAGALRTIRGLGPKMEEKLLEHLNREHQTKPKRWLYADAAVEVDAMLKHLRRCKAVERAEAAGSFRRRRDTVGDLDILATASSPSEVTNWVLQYPRAAKTLGSGDTKTTLVLNDGLQVDVRVLPAESYGAALIYFTGSQAHCIHIRRIAQKMRLSLNEYGLMRAGKSIAGRTEEEVYAKLGMAWIPPEMREDRGEVEAALENRLPRLIERSDLRGDLHTHSTYTDGRASIEEMARAAKKAGLEYFAVTDHSQRLAMVHGLDPARLREQWREIETVQTGLSGIKLLRGIEVDILDDGSLDLPDEVLAELDWVVASVHSKLNQPAPEMTQRLIKAIRNRHVDVIGHPTGRLIDKRDESTFDFGEVLRAARGEGCALEVNSQPDRLDLVDTACMAAKHAGVKLVISTDAHSSNGFDLIELGLAQARRGWIEPSDVLNTRPLRDLRQRR